MVSVKHKQHSTKTLINGPFWNFFTFSGQFWPLHHLPNIHIYIDKYVVLNVLILITLNFNYFRDDRPRRSVSITHNTQKLPFLGHFPPIWGHFLASTPP